MKQGGGPGGQQPMVQPACNSNSVEAVLEVIYLKTTETNAHTVFNHSFIKNSPIITTHCHWVKPCTVLINY